MNYLYTFLFSFLSAVTIFAQDTTIVQTFQWADDDRSRMVDFPQGSQSYRQILMRYNMRCHNALVSNSSAYLGCREWDYSCNTFITDPTRTDSTELTHPSYTFSAYDNPDFYYSDGQTYTHQIYQLPTATLSNNSTIAKPLGNSNGTQNIDAGSTFRTQIHYTAAELASATLNTSLIQQLSLTTVSGTSQIRLAQVRIKHIAPGDWVRDEAIFHENDWEEVFLGDVLAQDALTFDFHTPFTYDGSSDLLIDISGTSDGALSIGDETLTGGDFALINTANNDYALECQGLEGINVPSNLFSGVLNEVTVAFWAYGSYDFLPANATIFEALDDQGNRQLNVHLPWSNGQVYWDAGNEGSGYDRINKTALEEEYLGWNHWAFVKNATSGVMNIYHNGTLWHSASSKTNAIQNIATCTFGRGKNNGEPWKGLVDDLTIWKSALTGPEIIEMVQSSSLSFHSQANELVAEYNFNEGNGRLAANTQSGEQTDFILSPNWYPKRGLDSRQGASVSNDRWAITLHQGSVNRSLNTITYVDSFANTANTIAEYGVDGTDLVLLNTLYEYNSLCRNVDDKFQYIDDYVYPIDGYYISEDLSYYSKTPAKYEILSLVTPYGGGINLGPTGKTFWFDVTDYAPILQGSKNISVELGGQNQEELDIQFYFIEGTPPANVKDIRNIWPFKRGYFNDIRNNNVFEPRDVVLRNDASQFKLRTTITGHQQNGEFVKRNHYLSVGSDKKNFDVWKECGFNPIYPQGGTWIYDRAGWCPGMPSLTTQWDITSLVSPGGTATIDYGVNGSTLTEANYLVSAQLVEYGPKNFTRDGSIYKIKRPNGDEVTYERENPICTQPVIVIRNEGSEAMTSAQFTFGIVGGAQSTASWSGNLGYLETAEVVLPIPDASFWGDEDGEFYAILTDFNNMATDENTDNNRQQVPYFMPDRYENLKLQLSMSNNNIANDTEYRLEDINGNVILEHRNIAGGAKIKDELDLPQGCYRLVVSDSANDGLSFWAIPGNGSGSIQLKRGFGDIFITAKTFDSDFGGGFTYEFYYDQVVGTDEAEFVRRLSLFPNPAQSFVHVEWEADRGFDMEVQLLDLTGKVLKYEQGYYPAGTHLIQLGISELPAGTYIVKLFDGISTHHELIEITP